MSEPTPDQFLGAPQAAEYRPTASSINAWSSASIDGRPWFDWADAERMRRDPQILFGLGILRSPLYRVQFKVQASTPEVGQLVQSTLKRFWKCCLPKVTKFFEYGVHAGELTYRLVEDRIELDQLDDFHPYDVRPLEFAAPPRKGRLAGVRVKSVRNKGSVDLLSPHAWWFSGYAEYGQHYGRPRMAGSFEPWLEKRSRHGAVDSRRLWYQKSAFGGPRVRFPVGTTREENGIERDNRQIAREIGEKDANGTVVVMPNSRDPVSKEYHWQFEDPKTRPDVAGLLDYPKELDREILIGMGIPPELVDASTTGSGYAGRAIPAQVFFTSMDETVALILDAIERLILGPLVAVNFGPEASYEIEAESLAEAVAADPSQAKQMMGLGGDEAGQADPMAGLGLSWSSALAKRVKDLALAEYPDLPGVELGWTAAQTRTGSTKAVGTGPDAGRTLYGQAAQRALRQSQSSGEAATSTRDRRAAAEEARSHLAAIASDPAQATPQRLNQLSQTIGSLTVEQLREARRQLGARFGANATRREQMAEVIRQRVAEISRGGSPRPTPERTPERQQSRPATPAAPAPRTVESVVAAVRSRSFVTRDERAATLSRMSPEQQTQVRMGAGLPFDQARANLLATDPFGYTRALASALFDMANRPPTTATGSTPSPNRTRTPPPGFVPPPITGGASDRPRPPANVRIQMQNRQAVARVFGRDLDDDTLKSVANAFHGGTVEVSVMGNNIITRSVSPDGSSATRTFFRNAEGKLECHNDYFRIADDSYYNGHGVGVFLNQVRGLKAAGVDVITTHAAGSLNHPDFNGYYTWPRFGYEATIDNSQFARLPADVKRKMGNSRSMLKLFETEGGPEAWKRHGSDLYRAHFDLSDGSPNIKALESYLEVRRNRS